MEIRAKNIIVFRQKYECLQDRGIVAEGHS
jgi:hypothetical protein